MAGALFNILIPTEQHEVHLSQHAICNCSTTTKHLNNDGKIPNTTHFPISMKKVSTYEI